jgi:general secretion pathway protein D
VLIVRFSTSGPVQVTTKQIDPGTIEITVSNGVERAGPPPKVQVRTTFEPTQGDGYEMVMLRYADVSEIVGLLTDGLTVRSNDNFVPREPGFGSQNLTGTSYTQPTPNGPDQSNEPLGQSADSSIAIDRRLNAIWLKGTPERIAHLKAQIAQIDLPVDSVVLETELVELDANGSHEIGIDFANAAGQLATFTSQSGQFIPAGDLANTGGHLNQAGSVVGGRLDSGGLQAAVYAQVSKGNGKIVSRPRIVAQSGGTAKIITGDALPILTAITLSGVNGVSQQVQYVNVGVTLQIAPRVSADGFVTSHVFCVVSSATGTSQGYPTISQREAETQVTVKDGETFVIGGLTQDTTSNRDSKVPGLGDIPMVGQLFHHKSMSKQKTELYIVVTPHVIHHGQSSVAASIR